MSEPSALRVLLVTKGLDIGGIERMVVDLANALARHGADVHVAVVNDRRDALLGQLQLPATHVHRLGGTDRMGWRSIRALARLVRSATFDVVHVHGPLPAVVARLIPGHRPIVTTSHTPLQALHPATRVAWRLTARLDAASIAVSAAVASSMPTRIAARMQVIPHGLDVNAVEAARAHATPRTGDHVRLVTVASHRDAKNYPNLLRAVQLAIRKGADISLVAVGDGPDLERHRALAAELGLASVVVFRPATAEVLQVIAGADLLVVASDYEGQPLVVMEALALGVPVVATAVGRVPELVTPSVGRVVAPGDTEALAKAIAELALDRERLIALTHNITQSVGSWTLDEVAKAHLGVYRHLATESHEH